MKNIDDGVTQSRLRFEWILRALAQSSVVQRSLYPPFVEVADELALEFEECLRAFIDSGASASVTPAQMELIEKLDRQMEAMSGPEKTELWTDEALQMSSLWQNLRDTASCVLNALGWPLSPPPIQRGGIYVGPQH